MADELLLGKYRLEEALGQGGMGAVYRARHVGLDQPVAIKFLSSEAGEDPQHLARFLREARVQARLKSPHVCQVFDVDTLPDGRPFMVLELLEGKTLDKVVRETPAPPWTERVGWIIEACEGLAVAHEAGLVHRDVKPANLMRARVGGRWVVKVLDFGIAKLDDGVDLTGDAAIGTLRYMAPEQVLDSRTVQPASDLWAMGITLYRLLTGRLPFTGEDTATYVQSVMRDEPASLRARLPEVPPQLEAVVHQALQKDPSRRPASARSFAEALRRTLPGEETQPQVHAPSGPTDVVRPRRPRWVPLGVTAVALALISVAAVVARASQERPPTIRPESAAPAIQVVESPAAPPEVSPSPPTAEPTPTAPASAEPTPPTPETPAQAPKAAAPEATKPTPRVPASKRIPPRPAAVVPEDENPDHL